MNQDELRATVTANVIAELHKLAKENINKKDLFYQLASAMIYAGLAEFIADTIVFTLKYRINDITKRYLQNNIGLTKGMNKKTNLEASIERLKFYTFDDKEELIKILVNIKNSRNKLTHNLFLAHLKNINIDKEIKDTQKYVEELLDFWLKRSFFRQVS